MTATPLDKFKDAIKEILPENVEILETQQTNDRSTDALNRMKDSLSKFLHEHGSIADGLGDKSDSASKEFSKKTKKLREAVDEFNPQNGNEFNKSMAIASKAMDSIGEELKSSKSSFWNTIKDAWNAVKNWVKSIFSGSEKEQETNLLDATSKTMEVSSGPQISTQMMESSKQKVKDEYVKYADILEKNGKPVAKDFLQKHNEEIDAMGPANLVKDYAKVATEILKEKYPTQESFVDKLKQQTDTLTRAR